MSDPCLDPSPQIDLTLIGGALRATPILSPDFGNGFENRGNGIWTPGRPQIVTALPSSPSDGDPIAVRIPTGASGSGFWRFIYDASETSAFKWLFTGGAALYARRNNSGTISPSGLDNWVTLSATDAAGPSVVLPFSGYYNGHFGARVDSAADGAIARVGISVQGSDPSATDEAVNANSRTTSIMGTHDPMANSYGAGDTLRLMYRCSGSTGTATFQERWMSVLPVKVG
jgi:hypothetical protein